MAKPIPVAPTTAHGASFSSFDTYQPSQDWPTRPRRRRKPPSVSSNTAANALAPSPALLSLLSALASSSVAAGSPAPPAFLCPSASLTRPEEPTKRKAKRTARTLTTTAAGSASRANLRQLADKYERGDDGSWRRIESYSLYGVCAGCTATPVSAIDEQPSKGNGDDTDEPSTTTPPILPPAPTRTSMAATILPDTFPPGWEPKTHRWGHESRRTLILAVSLVLTFVICILIIACLLWRKSMRKKMRERDIERKGKGRQRNRQLREAEARESAAEKEARSKQKMWARATARWREHARLSARQRRPKRTSIRSRTRRSSFSRDDDDDTRSYTSSSGRTSPTASSSSRLSRTGSRRHSTSSLHQQEAPTDTSSQSPQQEATPISPPTISLSPPPVLPQSSPPAYQQNDSRNEPSSNRGFYASELTSGSQRISPEKPSPSSYFDRSENEESEELASIPTAHVATDDKAVLARLATLASAPPEEDNGTSSADRDVVVSAPEWHEEEEIEELIAQTAEIAAGAGVGGAAIDREGRPEEGPCAAAASPFPPPPSKANLLAPNFYDYPYSFEEMEMPGMDALELGPSAPPFEERPSAPIEDGEDLQLLASAPPLMDDDDFEGFYVQEASAPSALLEGQEEGMDDTTNTALEDEGPTLSRTEDGEQRLPDYHP